MRERPDRHCLVRKYPGALAHKADPVGFAEAVARQGYATDPPYAKKLASIINLHVTPLLAPAPAKKP